MYRLRVKEAIEAKKIKEPTFSQGILSRKANIPPNLISRMVNDPEKYHPSYDTLFRVAEVLGVSAMELVEKIDRT